MNKFVIATVALAAIVSMLDCAKNDQTTATGQSQNPPTQGDSVAPAAPADPKAAPEVSNEPTKTATDVTAIDSEAKAKSAVGKFVRVSGKAEDAKIAGVVVTGDLVVYCLDRRFGWSDKVGTQVTVAGKLEYTDRFKAKEMPNGAMRPGTADSVFAIESCATQ